MKHTDSDSKHDKRASFLVFALFKDLPSRKAAAGPSDAFIPGLTPEVFCVGG